MRYYRIRKALQGFNKVGAVGELITRFPSDIDSDYDLYRIRFAEGNEFIFRDEHVEPTDQTELTDTTSPATPGGQKSRFRNKRDYVEHQCETCTRRFRIASEEVLKRKHVICQECTRIKRKAEGYTRQWKPCMIPLRSLLRERTSHKTVAALTRWYNSLGYPGVSRATVDRWLQKAEKEGDK